MKYLYLIKKVYHFLRTLSKLVFYNLVCKNWILLFGKHDRRKLKYNVSLCLIFKNEAPFLKEWIDYHITIGVNHFYLYNNHSDDNFMEILQPYIKLGYITLTDWPYNKAQFAAYKHCYENYRYETNWLSFLDADEFFVPKYAISISDWLKTFDKFPSIVVHWRIFGKGGVIHHNYNKNVIEQYFICWDKFYQFGKCFINTRYNISSFNCWHVHHHTYMKYRIFGILISLPAVNQFGYICPVNYVYGGGNDLMKKSTIMCNHYYTKAWDIYKQKMNKTDVLRGDNNPRSKMQQFYKMENECVSTDYTISRFFIRMRLFQQELNRYEEFKKNN